MPLTPKAMADANEKSETAALEDDMSEDDAGQSIDSDSDDSWDDEEDGSLPASEIGDDDDGSAAAAAVGPPPSYAGRPPQHATSTPAGSPKAAGKAGAWFKKTFAAGKTGGWAGVKQSVTRHSAASSVASGDSETLAGGAVTPAPGSPTRRRGVSRLSGWSGIAGEAPTPAVDATANLRTRSNRSLASSGDGRDEDEGEEAMPAPAMGPVPLGMRLPTHHRGKLHTDLADLALVQELDAHTGVIWAAAFSCSGRHLATAGQDTVLRVWAVIPNRGSSAAQPSSAMVLALPGDAPAMGSDETVPGREACPVFEQQPAREWRGHEREVLALGWSASDFLASGSMDGNVRLWQLSRADCLRVFKHADWVTAVQFHPTDDTKFVSTSIDGKVRLWSVPERRELALADVHEVRLWSVPERRELALADVHEMATAAAWAPGGCRVAVGTLKGKVRFYAADDNGRLEYEAQIDVKNRRGKSKSGRKVTGLAFQPGGRDGGGLLLVTSADARLRLFDGYTLVCKAKGPTLGDARISAAFSPDGRQIACGSEDGWAFLWDTIPGGPPAAPPDKNTCWEAFFAGRGCVTAVLAAPDAARRVPAVLARAAANRLGAPWGPPEPAVARSSRNLTGRAAEAVAAGEASIRCGAGFGAVYVAAHESGRLVVAESLAAPQWL